RRARSFLMRPGVEDALFAARRTCPGFRLDGPMLMATNVSPQRAAKAKHSTVIEHLVDCALALEQAADAAAERRTARDAVHAAALPPAAADLTAAPESHDHDHDEAVRANSPAW